MVTVLLLHGYNTVSESGHPRTESVLLEGAPVENKGKKLEERKTMQRHIKGLVSCGIITFCFLVRYILNAINSLNVLRKFVPL